MSGSAASVRQLAPRARDGMRVEEVCPEAFFHRPPLRPFSDEAFAFLGALGKALLATGTGQRPELIALAHWLRRANLLMIQERFQAGIGPTELAVARGVVFHVAPANVDSIFVYSWALALLAGNSNVIRVSQDFGDNMADLLAAVRKAVAAAPDGLGERTVVLTYPHDTETSSWLSRHADVRMIWGGDDTIRTFRGLPAPPAVRDVTFADKFSYTVLSAARVVAATSQAMADLARAFYNDAYWFDQMACSSPRLVYFLGPDETCEQASGRFWDALEAELARREHADDRSVAVEKLVFIHERAAGGMPFLLKGPLRATAPAVMRITAGSLGESRETCGGGVFFECFLGDLRALRPLVRRNDQTLSHWGIDRAELVTLVHELRGTGIDRVVPVGEALQFEPTWDGYAVLNELTRRVVVRV